MEYINLEKWPRKKHFEYFDRADYPYSDGTVQVDITSFLAYVKEHGHRFFPSLLYCLLKGVNEIGEFKVRVLEDGVARYDRIHASITVPIEGERFVFCRVEYKEDVRDFLKTFEAASEEAKKEKELAGSGCFDVIWVSCNPWFSFTSAVAPTADRRMRSIPVFLVGKYYEAGGRTFLPLSIKVLHALIDGVHIGHLLAHFENSFSHPENIFG